MHGERKKNRKKKERKKERKKSDINIKGIKSDLQTILILVQLSFRQYNNYAVLIQRFFLCRRQTGAHVLEMVCYMYNESG